MYSKHFGKGFRCHLVELTTVPMMTNMKDNISIQKLNSTWILRKCYRNTHVAMLCHWEEIIHIPRQYDTLRCCEFNQHIIWWDFEIDPTSDGLSYDVDKLINSSWRLCVYLLTRQVETCSRSLHDLGPHGSITAENIAYRLFIYFSVNKNGWIRRHYRTHATHRYERIWMRFEKCYI